MAQLVFFFDNQMRVDMVSKFWPKCDPSIPPFVQLLNAPCGGSVISIPCLDYVRVWVCFLNKGKQRQSIHRHCQGVSLSCAFP